MGLTNNQPRDIIKENKKGIQNYENYNVCNNARN